MTSMYDARRVLAAVKSTNENIYVLLLFNKLVTNVTFFVPKIIISISITWSF